MRRWRIFCRRHYRPGPHYHIPPWRSLTALVMIALGAGMLIGLLLPSFAYFLAAAAIIIGLWAILL